MPLITTFFVIIQNKSNTVVQLILCCGLNRFSSQIWVKQKVRFLLSGAFYNLGNTIRYESDYCVSALSVSVTGCLVSKTAVDVQGFTQKQRMKPECLLVIHYFTALCRRPCSDSDMLRHLIRTRVLEEHGSPP